MKTKKNLDRIKDIPKIRISDPDHAADEIIPGVIKSNVLFYDNRTPVVRMPLHYERIKTEDAELIIANLIEDKSKAAVPNKEIKEALKRLCYMPELQIDLSEEFWKKQFYVNLAHGAYDIMQQTVIPRREEDIYDYFINIRYIPNCKLDDAPNFKKYVESS